MLDKIFNRGGTGGYSDDEQHGPQGSTASVHDLVPVQHLYGNVLVLKDGSYRMIMKVGAVNFDLKSDREKSILLATFGEVLNTLQVDFPMQILLHSSHMDTEAYVREYRNRLLDSSISVPMRAVIEDHIAFFEEQARTNFLLDRGAFIVVPFWDRNAAPTGDGGAAQEALPLGGALSRFMDGSSGEKRNQKGRRDMEKARIQLENRCGLIAAGLGKLNIAAQVLDELAVMRLLAEMYNPDRADRGGIQQGSRGGMIHTTRRREDRWRGDQPQIGPGGQH